MQHDQTAEEAMSARATCRRPITGREDTSSTPPDQSKGLMRPVPVHHFSGGQPRK